MTIERDVLFGYEYDTVNNETNSKPKIGEYFGQFLLDMAFQYNSMGKKSPNRNIDRIFREKEDFNKIEDMLIKVSEGFYEFSQYDVQLLLRVSNMKSPFSMVFPDEIDFFKENLSLSYDDDYLNRIVKLRNEFPYLHKILNFSYNGLKNTFTEVYKEISEIFFIDRRLIGFPEKSISMDSNSGKQLRDFKLAYNTWQQQDGKEMLLYFSKKLLFKIEPVISIDHDNNNIKLLLGDRYLRNTGSGFWSLTFIIYGIIYCLVKNKPILVIEEPESHLHPDLQAILADFFIHIVTKHKLTIVLETHSEYLTRRCQIRVFQHHNKQLTSDPVEEVKSMYDLNNFSCTSISKDSVTINSFEIEDNGDKVVSKCVPLELKEDGQLEPGYPPSFASQSNQDAWHLMKLRNSSN